MLTHVYTLWLSQSWPPTVSHSRNITVFGRGSALLYELTIESRNILEHTKITISNSCLFTVWIQKSYHMSDNIFQTLLDLCQVWCCDHSPEKPFPGHNNPLDKESFTNIQSKPLLTQLHAIASSPITGHSRKEITACPSSSPHEKAVDSYEVSVSSRLNRSGELNLRGQT